jgi:nicotinamidase-related amidase
MDTIIELALRTQELRPDGNGYLAWRIRDERLSLAARRITVVVCDMWDRNWSRAANERAEPLARRIDAFLEAVRAAGMTVIHAPSETVDVYAGTPARERILRVPRVPLPDSRHHADPPLPIDDSDGGSDSNLGGERVHTAVWTRQTDLIRIDQDRDCVSDSGVEIHGYMVANGIRTVLLCGVHANMCVMNRSFGIRNFASRGIDVALLRDLTDSLYNPARPPYVSHDEGTALMVGYIEKFWCPTVDSREILGALAGG